MKKIDIYQAVSLLANLGVIAGIVFLALEIQQNSELMEVQISQSRSDTSIASATSIINSPYLPAIIVKLDNGEELTQEEGVRYSTFMRTQFRQYDNIYRQYERGILGDEAIRDITSFLGLYFLYLPQRDLNLDIWEGFKTSLSEEFVRFVDEWIEELPDG